MEIRLNLKRRTAKATANREKYMKSIEYTSHVFVGRKKRLIIEGMKKNKKSESNMKIKCTVQMGIRMPRIKYIDVNNFMVSVQSSRKHRIMSGV